MNVSNLLQLEDIVVTAVQGYGLHDIYKYSKGQQSVYIKHVFMPNLQEIVKPEITVEEIDFLRSLDSMYQYCYVLVYVKCKQTGRFDTAFFMDDGEAIKGTSKSDVTQRLADFQEIAKIIRNVLL
ncbi:hypothetical protein [Pseudoalteromonas rubra]|uniref:hypothetical protein n=1 Tax=Pseudoalteromonas rubra TaxID=43658 RepID=UPI002016962A|nr:hypothetical protein [Pseudoalteromonas rubra]